MALIIFALAFLVAGALLSGFVLMVILGALGHIFSAEWLCVSFWQAVVVGIALSILGGYLKKDTR